MITQFRFNIGRAITVMLLVGASLLAAVPAQAGCFTNAQMLDLVSQGRVRSMPSLLSSLGAQRLVSAQLCENGNTLYYRVRYWNASGQVVSVSINARTGQRL